MIRPTLFSKKDLPSPLITKLWAIKPQCQIQQQKNPMLLFSLYLIYIW